MNPADLRRAPNPTRVFRAQSRAMATANGISGFHAAGASRQAPVRRRVVRSHLISEARQCETFAHQDAIERRVAERELVAEGAGGVKPLMPLAVAIARDCARKRGLGSAPTKIGGS